MKSKTQGVRWTTVATVAAIVACVVLLLVYPVIELARSTARAHMFHPQKLPPHISSLPAGEVGVRIPVNQDQGRNKNALHHIQHEIQVVEIQNQHNKYNQDGQSEGKGHPVILFAHGNAGYLSAERCAMLRRVSNALSCTIVGFDYRGFGLSSPRDFQPTETSILEDGDAVLDYVSQIHGASPIWVWGESMGSSVAAHLAQDPRVAGIVLHVGFARLQDVAEHTSSRMLHESLHFLVPTFLALLDDTLDNAKKLAAPRAANKPAALIVALDDELMSPRTANALEQTLRQNERSTLRVNVRGTHGAHDLDAALPPLANFMRR